jgi:hypothetical protein
MNNIDPTENGNEENPIKPPPKPTTSRNGLHKKINGNVSSKDSSKCTVS